MKSFQVGDKVRIKVKDSYKFWNKEIDDIPRAVALAGKVCTVTSVDDDPKSLSVFLNETGFMGLDDIEPSPFTLKEYMDCLDKGHPARKEYEELMECKFRLEGLEK